MKTREEKIVEFVEDKMRVEFVSLINKTFKGLTLPKDQTGIWVADAIDQLIGEVSGIGDLTGTGLGMRRIGLDDES